MSDLEIVASRHPDIPQDALPGIASAAHAPASSAADVRPTKSVDFAVCPAHELDVTQRNEGKTGLIRTADGHVVFRDHTKRLGSVSVPCSGSGTVPPEVSS